MKFNILVSCLPNLNLIRIINDVKATTDPE